MARAALKRRENSEGPGSPLTAECLDRLSGVDQDRVIDRMIADAQTGTSAQRAHFEHRRAAGLGIGLDQSGRLVAQASVKD